MACSSDCSYNTNSSILPPALESNPDISGIGVLIGFVGTAYVTFGILLLQYFIGAPRDTKFSDCMNSVDKHLLESVWRNRLWRHIGKPLKHSEPALKSIVLALSDAQLVTGLSILASGYSQIACGLSIFHWHIVVFLAWFSSTTHLTTLTFLRRYIHDKRGFRTLRLVLMLLLVGLLSFALIPTGGQCGMQNADTASRLTSQNLSPQNITIKYPRRFLFPGAAVKCCFSQLFTSGFIGSDKTYFLSMLASQAVLLIGTVTRATKMFRWSSTFAKEWLRNKPARVCKRVVALLGVLSKSTQIKVLQQCCFLISSTIIVFIIFARAIYDLVESSLWETSWLFFSLVWGTSRIFVVRTLATKDWARSEKNEGGVLLHENRWGFGQWMATTLLVLPLLGFCQTYLDGRQIPLTETTTPTLETNILNSGESIVDAPTAKDSTSSRLQSTELQRANSRHDTNSENVTDNSIDITLAPRTGIDLINMEQQLATSTEIASMDYVDPTERILHVRPMASPLQGTQRPWPAQAFYDHDFHGDECYRDMLVLMYGLLLMYGITFIIYSFGIGAKTIQVFVANFTSWFVYITLYFLFLYTAMCISVERNPTRIDGLIWENSRYSHKKIEHINGMPSTNITNSLVRHCLVIIGGNKSQPVQINLFRVVRRLILLGTVFVAYPGIVKLRYAGIGLSGGLLIICCVLLACKKPTQPPNNTDMTEMDQSRTFAI